MNRIKTLTDNLRQAMSFLYRARGMAAGSEGPVNDKYFPDMDMETFDEIVRLQELLSRLIWRLQERGESDEVQRLLQDSGSGE